MHPPEPASLTPRPQQPASLPPSADSIPEEDFFADRHLGPGPGARAAMLAELGLDSLEALVSKTVPVTIRLDRPLDLPIPCTEQEALRELAEIASHNSVLRSHIGLGYHECIVPPVIQRNILENPGWYTQYTPYQAEISQGRLEALLNFQTMVCELTGLDFANASLLDEPTAAAEAMGIAHRAKGTEKRRRFFVASSCHPQTVEVLRGRAAPCEIEVVVGNPHEFQPGEDFFGLLVQYPTTFGAVEDYSDLFRRAGEAGCTTICAADPLALVLLRPPGEFGADICVGSAQRFGVPMGFGGPHAAFMAVRDPLKRHMPGRLIGVSIDAKGKKALRLALQTREQHIRREKATSNICTAQALLAIMASMYAVYHGPVGLRRIALSTRSTALHIAAKLKVAGFKVGPALLFDTLTVFNVDAATILAAGVRQGINLRRIDASTVGITVDEATFDLAPILKAFGLPYRESVSAEISPESDFPEPFRRTTPCLQHAIFRSHHTETEFLRYVRKLESRDLSLTTSMIPLGSCTMKLNATAEMLPVTWEEFSRMHPFAPPDQAEGYHLIFRQLQEWLAEITGFAATSLQPNAGSQGEYAGLLVIRAFHLAAGNAGRNICLIPQSAHGTNPASAAMAGFEVVPVRCDTSGNVDLEDLESKAAGHAERLAALMITYPSTHGVFEEGVSRACELIHKHGGQVYMDGANMNAQVGLCRPGDLGADVCHLNLHKTFCIPHGGGGPGVGPICVASHLAPFLPAHPLAPCGGSHPIEPVAGAPFGSASILVIPWMYIRMMGPEGLADATRVAILNANYIARRLEAHYPILYRGTHGFVAHECILDLRALKATSGIEVEDVAKRLMDYGFHAPTMSWPVPGTLMIEPTESESKAELDRFCEAMIRIRGEIEDVTAGRLDRNDNPLKHAPHTAETVVSDQWDRSYSRELGAFPAPWCREHKFWPAVSRVDNVYGDRNLFCTCSALDPETPLR